VAPPPSCADTPSGFSAALAQGGAFGLAACLTDAGGFQGSYPASTHLHFLMPSGGPAAGAQLQALATWADGTLGASGGGFPAIWPAADLAGNDYFVQIGMPAQRLVEQGIRSALLPSLRPMGVSSLPYQSVVVEPDPSQLDVVLGVRVADLRTLRRLTPAPSSPAGSPERDAYEAVRASIEGAVGTRFISGEVVSDEPEKACASLCLLRTESVALPGGAKALRERVYSFGAIARDALWVTRDDTVTALVLLAPGGTPGLTLTFDTTATRSSVDTRVTAYDRLWNVLSPPRDVEVSWAADFATRFTRKASDGPALGNIVTCDGRFAESLAMADLTEDVSIGPYPAVFSASGKLDHGSLLGWFPNPKGGAKYFAREPVATLDGSWPLEGAVAQPMDHPATVWRAAKESALSVGKRFGWIPMSIETCFAESGSWLPVATGCAQGACGKPLARVTNVSIGDFEMTRAQCEDTAGYVLSQSEASMLWVIAAGNGAASGRGRDTPKLGCPQTLGERRNAVVVAALDGDELWSHSDYGVRYADIAANGQLGSEMGTSLAAPRVAAVAAALAQDFPKLSPAGIRLSLLLSAAPSVALQTKVRSGGRLDASVAREVAACLASDGVTDRAHAESCLRSSSYAGDVAAKITLLADRGTFSP
jgi:hypothetical protein